ncbi:hypothetical protein IFM89_029720 [Coptis chinensis]|uniref:Uncharacterized protein n=1 Tax=Coptis chinensis TaxID=261450 RepID=A0A835H1S8_9MAGN|nr:hypothetical protein IFM89_029720 [Coptis chinensis]
MSRGVNIASKASPCGEVYNVAIKGMERTLREVEDALKNMALNSDQVHGERSGSERKGETSATCTPFGIQKSLLDPPVRRGRGRPSRKRIESGADKGPVRKNNDNPNKPTTLQQKPDKRARKQATDKHASNKIDYETQMYQAKSVTGHSLHPYNVNPTYEFQPLFLNRVILCLQINSLSMVITYA